MASPLHDDVDAQAPGVGVDPPSLGAPPERRRADQGHRAGVLVCHVLLRPDGHGRAEGCGEVVVEGPYRTLARELTDGMVVSAEPAGR